MFAACKANLCLVARNETKLLEVADQCKQLGAETIVVTADVTEKIQCEKIIHKTVEKFGDIDILINCAAIHFSQYIKEGLNFNDIEYMFNANYWGSVYCTYYALPYLKKRKGQIIAICSILGKIISPGNSIYCSSKFALSAFFETLRIELRGSGVGITLVYPGYLKERMQGAQEKQTSLLKSLMVQHLGISSQTCTKKIFNDIYDKKEEDIFPLYAKIVVHLNVFFPHLIKRMVSLINNNREKTGRNV